MSSYRPIDCGLHDYFEIACLYQYKLELVLEDGQSLFGVARNTCTRADGAEYLILETPSPTRLAIRLDRVDSMRALTANSMFQEVSFRIHDAREPWVRGSLGVRVPDGG